MSEFILEVNHGLALFPTLGDGNEDIVHQPGEGIGLLTLYLNKLGRYGEGENSPCGDCR